MKLIDTIKSKALRTIRVPKDLTAITTFSPDDEVDPADAAMTREGVDEIWTGVENLYRTGIYPGITFCLRRQGRVVINRGIGHSHGNGPGDFKDSEKILMTPDTPVCQYSASKAVTAMLIHLLAERGEIDLSDPIIRYIPEFGLHGKKNITIYNIISHHGGVPTPPFGVDPEILYDHDGFVSMICNLKPTSKDGRSQAYHAITGGVILGEIVKRVTGRDVREFLAETIQKPLGFKYFNYGVPEKDIKKVAVNYDTGPPLVFPISTMAKRALSVSWGDVVRISNEPRFMQVIIPAANIVATADEMSQFFQMMLNGGELNGRRIFKPETIHRAIAPAAKMWFDGTMVVPMRYSAGMMLGASPVGMWGPFSESAYGHVGFINIFCWADPARDIAVSLQTTGKSLIGPHLLALSKLLFSISKHCPMAEATDDDASGSYLSFLGPFQKMLRKLLLSW
jgi:CubicO group peptidase (beta-lactamase class C family)